MLNFMVTNTDICIQIFNTLNAELNPICHLLALLGVHFLHVSRIRVKNTTVRILVLLQNQSPKCGKFKIISIYSKK